jgi:hypothetical protein
MLTAVIDTRHGPKARAATLSPLVRGVVEGVIGTAILVNPKDDPDIMAIADSAGCRVLVAESWAEGFARAVTNANGAGILVMEAGLQLGPDFWPILTDALPVLGARPAASEPAPRRGIFPSLAQIADSFRGRITRDCALLLPPSRARDIGLAKVDPFLVRYGSECVRLRTAMVRVRFE